MDDGFDKDQGRSKKRVRFAEQEEVHEFTPTNPPSEPPYHRSPYARLCRGSDVPAYQDALEDGGDACGDPASGMAASEIARRRRRELRDSQHGGDTSVLDDLATAEEDYDEPEELFNDAGIPIEPFHFRKEREEGYFDEDGNYIEHRLDNANDAWLDSLQDGPLNDSLPAHMPSSVGAGGEDDDESGLPAMDEDDIAIYKQRLVNYLRPGETVLMALRRLGGKPTSSSSAPPRQRRRARRSGGSNQQPQVADTGTSGTTAVEQPVMSPSEAATTSSSSQQQETSQMQSLPPRDTTGPLVTLQPGSLSVSASNGTGDAPQTPRSHGQLPSSSDTATFNPTWLPQQPQQHDAAALHTRVFNNTAGSSSQQPTSLVANGAAAVAGQQEGDVPTGEWGSGCGTASVGPSRRRMLPDDSIAFDKVTEYADLLLGSGEFDIYTTTCEQLLRQVSDASLQYLLGDQTQEQKSAETSAGAANVPSASNDEQQQQQQQQQPSDQTATTLQQQQQQQQVAEDDIDMFSEGDDAKAAAQPGGTSAAAAVAAKVEGCSREVEDDVDMTDAEEDHSAAATAGNDAAPNGDLPAAVHSLRTGPSDASRQVESPSSPVGVSPVLQADTTAHAAFISTDGSFYAGVGGAPASSAMDTDRLEQTVREHGGYAGQPVHPQQSANAATAARDASADNNAMPATTVVSDDAHMRTSNGGEGVGGRGVLDGFVFDDCSGYYYNSELGYYYDPGSTLFGDAASGLWYRYDENGQYQLVS
eukprot:jgi/Chrzof1/13742/Cz08g10120.t1